MQDAENTKCLPHNIRSLDYEDSNIHKNTVNIWTSSFDEGWGAENLPRSLVVPTLGQLSEDESLCQA